MIDCIILCGALGKWLSSNALVNVNNKPLIGYQLDYIEDFPNIDKIILAVRSYNVNTVKDFIEGRYNKKKIEMSVEETPLDTGGAVKRALNFVNRDFVLIFNYNDFVNLNIFNLERFVREKDNNVICISSYFVSPYGLFLEEGFKEKPRIHMETSIGWYVFKTRDIKRVFSDLPERFSLEYLVFERNLIEYDKYNIGEGSIWIPVHSREDIEKVDRILNKRF